MTRFTVRFRNDKNAEWVEQRAEETGLSKARVVEQAVTAVRTGDVEERDSGRDSAEVRTRLDDLEETVETLREQLTDDSGADRTAPTRTGPVQDAPSRTEPGRSGAERGGSGRDAPDSAGADRTETVSDDLDGLLEDWNPGRTREEREQRRALGRQVLEWVRETEGHVSASDIKDALYPDLATDAEEQSEDTWWRKIARPALQAAVDDGLAEYRDGYHDYRWVGEGR